MSSRKELYYDYLSELKLYNQNLIFMDNDQIFKNYEEVAAFRDLEWIDIYYGVECVGFILLTYGSHCPETYDWFIMECFVAEPYRRKHLMTGALKRLFQTHQGTFGLFILSSNLTASKFWKNFLNENKNQTPYAVSQIPVLKSSVPSSVDCYEMAFEVIRQSETKKTSSGISSYK